MKKILALLLAVVMVFALVACSSNTDKTEEKKDDAQTSTPTDEKTEDKTEDAADDKAEDTTDDKPAASGETVVAKLVCVGPLTGDYSQYGLQNEQAAQLAIDAWNEKGVQVDGKTVEFQLASYDDAGKVDEAAAVAEQIVSDDEVIAVINAHFQSSVALVACQTYQNAGILAISNASSHPDYTKIGEYCCRNNVTDLGESRNGIQMLIRMGYKRIALVAEESDFGVSALEYGQQNIQAVADLGVEVECVAAEYFAQNTDDYSAVLSKVNATNPDVVMNYGTYTQIAPFCIQKVKAGYEWDIMAVGNAMDEKLLEAGGDAVEGICMPALFNSESEIPAVKEFISSFKDYTGSLPNCYSTNCYDSTNYVCFLVEQIGSLDREAIMKAAHELPYEGVTGTVMFDENNECEKVQYVMKIENGQFVELPGYLTTWDEFLTEVQA